MDETKLISKACENLLINCANLSKSEKLIILSEKEELGWYKKDLSEVVYNFAKNFGLKVDLLEVAQPQNDSRDKIIELIDKYDCALFFARIGDQDRFENNIYKTKRVMSYVKDKSSLISAFGTTSNQAMLEIKKIINNLIINSEKIEITCPLGTFVQGKIDNQFKDLNTEVSVNRFPVVVHAPILASNFSGKVVLANYLTPTGSKVYIPECIKLDKPITANLDSGKILGFDGDKNIVRKAEEHYKYVSDLFSIDKNVVHSWHAGIHPGIKYNNSIHENPDRWSNTVFASPKFLHFHTCGNYAPGEICWMILNHTVKIDGEKLYENGVLKVKSFQQIIDCINKWEDLKILYDL